MFLTLVVPAHFGMSGYDSTNHTGLSLVGLVVCFGGGRRHDADSRDFLRVSQCEEMVSNRVEAIVSCGVWRRRGITSFTGVEVWKGGDEMR